MIRDALRETGRQLDVIDEFTEELAACRIITPQNKQDIYSMQLGGLWVSQEIGLHVTFPDSQAGTLGFCWMIDERARSKYELREIFLKKRDHGEKKPSEELRLKMREGSLFTSPELDIVKIEAHDPARDLTHLFPYASPSYQTLDVPLFVNVLGLEVWKDLKYINYKDSKNSFTIEQEKAERDLKIHLNETLVPMFTLQIERVILELRNYEKVPRLLAGLSRSGSQKDSRSPS